MEKIPRVTKSYYSFRKQKNEKEIPVKEFCFQEHKKTLEEIRRNFLSRLTYNGIWLTPALKPKPYETVIIFDWDDTILCTSFINPTGVFNPNQKISNVVYK